ncbi:MAG: hypothetical protein LBU22_02310 [Dysgonamonadaceae bacterium]|jgi:RHS repeat-associated protein|nr:hypothetical protein [Dysgonamonadaceae bacterium]
MIKYNYLTLPQSVQFRNGNRVEYVYDAAGVKHRTRHKVTNRDMGYGAWSQSEPAESDFIAAQTVTTDYASNKVYKNGQLSMLLTEEGYIEKSGSTYTHHYYLKDHIGNHRIVMNSAGTVVQATNYYPSGTTMADYPRATTQGVQPYKFGGKELDRKDNLNFYDYEARAYDPTLMRFTSTDPMMEKYYGWSPFAYCLNNPVKYVDPDGKKVVLSGTHEFMLTTFYDLQRLSSNDLILLKNGTLMEFAKYNAKRDGGVLFIGMPEEGKTKTFGTSMMTDLIASKHTVSIKETTSFNKFEANSNDSRIEGKGSGGTIIYAPKDKGNNIKNVDGTYRRNPFIGLGHELIHASHAFKGIIKSMKENYKWDPDSVDGKPAQMSIEEYNTRMEENKIRQENNEKLRYLPQ